MDQVQFLDMFQKTIFLLMLIASPILLSAVIVGLAISIIQSVTQIQEQTLTFVPKIFAALIVLIVAAPWMTDIFITRVQDMFDSIKQFIS